MNYLICLTVLVSILNTVVNAQTLLSSDINIKEGLTILNLTGLGLKELKPRFLENPTIEELILQHNGIIKISYGAFDGLPALKTLDLSNNNLKVEDFFSFGNHSTLETLILDNNYNDYDNSEDTELSISFTLPRLTKLSMRNVKMVNISGNTFINMPRLAKIDLSGSKINTTVIMSTLPKTVTHLYLENNNITNLPAKHKEWLQHLKLLSLDGNQFDVVANLDDSIRCSSKNNTDGTLCFGLYLLENLSLAECGIQLIDDKTFKTNKLRSLNLSNNKIQEIDSTVVNLRLLKELDLSNNPLKRLLGDILDHIEILKMNNMKNNEVIVKFLKIQIWSQSLKVLSLSGNNLDYIPNDNIFNKFANLKELDLSRNALKTLDLQYQLTKLERLYLSDNAIEDITALSLQRAKNLLFLDIHNNSITNIRIDSLQNINPDLNILYKTTCQ